MFTKHGNTSRRSGYMIANYSINAEGKNVILGFHSVGDTYEIAMSHAEACRFAGRLLNRADYWACSRYNGRDTALLLGELPKAIAKGHLTEGQANKIRCRTQRQRKDL